MLEMTKREKIEEEERKDMRSEVGKLKEQIKNCEIQKKRLKESLDDITQETSEKRSMLCNL